MALGVREGRGGILQGGDLSAVEHEGDQPGEGGPVDVLRGGKGAIRQTGKEPQVGHGGDGIRMDDLVLVGEGRRGGPGAEQAQGQGRRKAQREERVQTFHVRFLLDY